MLARCFLVSPLSVVAAMLLSVILTRPLYAEIRYAVIDLGVLPGGVESFATGINASGQVTGSSTDGNSINTPFIYSNGVLTSLGFPFGRGLAINSQGQITGYHSTLPTNGFIYSGGQITIIPSLGGTYTDGRAINDLGQVVGSSATSGTQTRHAFLYSPNGQISDLGTLGGTDSYANGINNAGQIVGESYVTSGAEHAFLYSSGQMKDLGTLPGNFWSFAYAINDSGQITGSAQAASLSAYHAFLYSGGVMHDLGGLPEYPNSTGRAINSNGHIVGYSYNSGTSHAFLYTGGSMADLNTLIDPASGWTLTHALGVNDQDQIVGAGTNSLGQRRAFLLTAIPEPSTLAVSGFCILALLLIRRAKTVPRTSAEPFARPSL